MGIYNKRRISFRHALTGTNKHNSLTRILTIKLMYTEANMQPKVIFVGDTSLRYNHFGCQMVGQAFREQFSRVGLNLIASLPTNFYETISDWKELLTKADLVVVNGEGSIHHGRYQNLIDLACEFPCALVNCVFQENPENHNILKFKYISTRESYSAFALQEHGVKPNIVPDVIFVSSLLNSFIPETTQTKQYGFTDSVVKIKRRLGPFRIRDNAFSAETKVVGDYLNFLASHRGLAVGRFHATICCSVMGIPFSTYNSNTWKIQGLMKDMGIPHLHFELRQDAKRAIPKALPQSVTDYCVSAHIKVKNMFDELATIAKGIR